MQILELIREYNKLMSSCIEGPNCIDPEICHGDCCHIHIDIPRILAEYHINKNNADLQDFIRGNIFSFQIAVKKENSKCVFYDKEINGCSLHTSGMKPPQCWIYPTGFSNEPGEEKKFAEDGTITCKKIGGWKVVDEKSASKANDLLQDYIKFCKNEAKSENSPDEIKERMEKLKEKLKDIAPCSIAGVRDTWNGFKPLSADGFSLKLRKICSNVKENDTQKNCIFMECKNICPEVISILIPKLTDDLIKFINKNGHKRDYSFYELWK